MPAKRGEREERRERPVRTRGAGREGETTDLPADHGKTEELDVATAAEEGRRLIAAVTNKEPEGVTSVEPTDAGWVIEVEVLEDRHIPSSSDVLALYEVEVDSDGALLSYRRTQRYPRGRVESRSGGGS